MKLTQQLFQSMHKRSSYGKINFNGTVNIFSLCFFHSGKKLLMFWFGVQRKSVIFAVPLNFLNKPHFLGWPIGYIHCRNG